MRVRDIKWPNLREPGFTCTRTDGVPDELGALEGWQRAMGALLASWPYLKRVTQPIALSRSPALQILIHQTKLSTERSFAREHPCDRSLMLSDADRAIHAYPNVATHL